ncbi:hypothetical protein [Burkholderia guangdongensis]|uniref:hypothetical protein n=1 Tax=Burkholderia guangdongensis TaxID=1792500 RepID=UPI0015CE6E65|nr:hypothetical protein [Burkholderia guangdongensis]
MRSIRIALMLTIALAGLNASHVVWAQRPEPDAPRKLPRRSERQERPIAHPVERLPVASAVTRSPVPPALEQRRFDGHMTPEERHLLRQHIEDAVRELYKR